MIDYVECLFCLQVVESAVAGINKPSHIIYKLCLNKLGTSAEDTVFLDDMDANICAAKSLDIHSIKVCECFTLLYQIVFDYFNADIISICTISESVISVC